MTEPPRRPARRGPLAISGVPVATASGTLLAATALLAGCAQVITGQPAAPPIVAADRSLIDTYFERSNAAALEGADAQREFLEDTQHPDFASAACDLGDLTLVMDPTITTLRTDDDWRPRNSAKSPRGRVYRVAVTVTVQRDKAVIATQIGSVHIVILDDTAYGFAPCPA